MLVIGAKGFAKEILDLLSYSEELKSLAFYDDINQHQEARIFEKYQLVCNHLEAKNFFANVDSRFTLGIGNPLLRLNVSRIFEGLGGNLISTISPLATIGKYDVEIGNGSNIMHNALISNSVKLGIGCLVYFNSIITHDCEIGDFVEISPGVVILGRVYIGSFSQIGANSTILPDIRIGKNVVIGAGSVVTRDVPDNCMVRGVPAREYNSIS